MIPDFLSHYYVAANGPFRNLSDLPLEQAELLLDQLRTAGVSFAGKRSADYLAIRRKLEEQVRQGFTPLVPGVIARSGCPQRLRPHYMILGACPWVQSWYQDGSDRYGMICR